jgi:hypothetical protein
MYCSNGEEEDHIILWTAVKEYERYDVDKHGGAKSVALN